jgi:hypothetical protein
MNSPFEVSQQKISRGRQRGLRACFTCFSGCFLLLACVGVALLGSFFYIQSNQPAPLLPDFTPDPAQAVAVEARIENLQADVQRGGEFSFSVTESEASSWLNQEAQTSTQSDFVVENLQVTFRNGTASLYAETNILGLGRVAGVAQLQITVTPQGRLSVVVGALDFGGLAVPAETRAELAADLQADIDRELSQAGSDYRITRLIISDGLLTINGVTF